MDNDTEEGLVRPRCPCLVGALNREFRKKGLRSGGRVNVISPDFPSEGLSTPPTPLLPLLSLKLSLRIMSTTSTGSPSRYEPFDSKPVIAIDPYLKPHIPDIATRFRMLQKWLNTIDRAEGGLEKFSKGYERFGFNIRENGDVYYQEWAPNAVAASLIGDFSQ